MKVVCPLVFFILLVMTFVQCRGDDALKKNQELRRAYKEVEVPPGDKHLDEAWSDGDESHCDHVKTVTITKKVPVPYEVTIEKKVPYKVRVPVDKPYRVFVPKPFPVYVEKKVPYEIKVPLPEPYTVEKHVPVPVKVLVDRPYAVHVPHPYPIYVEKKVPYTVEKRVPYPVKVAIEKPYPVHVPVVKEVPIRVEKVVRYPIKALIDNPVPVPVEKPVPYPVETLVPYPVDIPVKEQYTSEEDIPEDHNTPEVYENNSSNEEVSNFNEYQDQKVKEESYNQTESVQYKNENDQYKSEPEQRDNEEVHDSSKFVDRPSKVPQSITASNDDHKKKHQSYSHVHTMSYSDGEETGFYSRINHQVT